MKSEDAVIPKGMEASYQQFHFAPGVRDGDRLFCSGQTGTNMQGKPAEPDAQFTQAFENVKAVLEEGGCSFDDVVEMTTFHVGFSDHIGTFMAVKDRFVSEPYPAWTAIGVSELAFGALVEIKVVARIPR